MTDLPNREDAVVPFEKLTEYLLSETHRDGKAKPDSFTSSVMSERMSIFYIMFHELDTVVLLHDHLEYGLLAGDVGTVVHVYVGGAALEVEFVTTAGRTVGVLTLGVEEMRPLGAHGVFHVQDLVPDISSKPPATIEWG